MLPCAEPSLSPEAAHAAGAYAGVLSKTDGADPGKHLVEPLRLLSVYGSLSYSRPAIDPLCTRSAHRDFRCARRPWLLILLEQASE